MEKGRPRKLLLFWWLVFIVLAGLIFLLAIQLKWIKVSQTSEPGLYSINHFIDGDTIAVNMNGSVETVRMIGVDTPETHKPNTPLQCYGNDAANYTKSLIGNNKVRLQADPLDTNRDRYGRLLRYVYLPDNTMIEESLIDNGYGFAYTSFPFAKAGQFKTKEQAAKAANLGLWGHCQVTVESNGVEQTNPAAQ